MPKVILCNGKWALSIPEEKEINYVEATKIGVIYRDGTTSADIKQIEDANNLTPRWHRYRTGDPKIQYTYPVDPTLTQTTINISALPKGIYSVILVCDGINTDSKNVMIQ